MDIYKGSLLCVDIFILWFDDNNNHITDYSYDKLDMIQTQAASAPL